MSRMKRILFAALTSVMGLILLEGLCSFAWLVPDYRNFRRNLPTAVQSPETFHARHDPEIGWVHVPGRRIQDFYGPGRHITINNDGFRGFEDYSDRKPSGRFRLVCLGDSFTLGFGVDDTQAYPAQLESSNPAVQAVNMGQGGYSIGQCFLWYNRDGDRLHADCLVFAFILDDIWRMKRGRMANGYAMPGFKLQDGTIQVTGQPVPGKIRSGDVIDDQGQFVQFLTQRNLLCRTVAASTGHIRKISTEEQRADQLRIALAIFDELHRRTDHKEIPFVLVLLPELRELADPTLRAEYHATAAAIKDFAAERNMPLLELIDDFYNLGQQAAESHYLREQWNHFSESGNRLVALKLDAFLSQKLPAYPRVKKNTTDDSSTPSD